MLNIEFLHFGSWFRGWRTSRAAIYVGHMGRCLAWNHDGIRGESDSDGIRVEQEKQTGNEDAHIAKC